MKNLAGQQCDAVVVAELTHAGIPVVPSSIPQANREPLTQYGGELAGWRFERAWYYWIARSENPLHIDHATAIWRLFGSVIRAGGDAACREPRPTGFPDAASYHIDTQDGLDVFAAYLRVLGADRAQ